MENYSALEIKHMAEQFNDYVISSKVNLEGITICVSNALCRVSGYSSDELMGEKFDFLFDDKDFTENFDDIKNKISQKKSWKSKIKQKNKNGSEFWTTIVMSPYYDENNNIIGYSTIQDDVTAQVKLVEINNDLENIVIEKVSNILNKDKQLLKHSKLAAMGEMMNAIAHQWKQPVHAISMAVSQITMCKNLGIEITDDILEKIVEQVDKQVDDLTKTIDEFRQFFKPNQHKELANIKATIEKTLLFLSDDIHLNNLNIELVGDDKLEYNIIPQEFKHVFINLIANARDAFIENNIEQRNMKITIEQVNDRISITVDDNAGGIPSNLIDEIFKVDVTSKADGKGTGIGLYMSTQIIEKLNGTISVKNILCDKCDKTSLGARFIISLPLN
jgi:PAS domain S-box-containing protein